MLERSLCDGFLQCWGLFFGILEELCSESGFRIVFDLVNRTLWAPFKAYKSYFGCSFFFFIYLFSNIKPSLKIICCGLSSKMSEMGEHKLLLSS